MPRKPVVKDFNDFMTKITSGDESMKQALYNDILYAQRERSRLRDKSKRQRERRKAQTPSVSGDAEDNQQQS